MVKINFWGGEGYLSAYALLAMGAVGMLDNLKNTKTDPNDKNKVITSDVTMTYDCLDYAENSVDEANVNRLQKSLDTYYKSIFGPDSRLSVKKGQKKISDDVSRLPANTEKADLKTKFKSSENLYIGISKGDTEIDIRNGIYGKPWVGEVYHSSATFAALYDNTQTIIINCGGYKGGGTAATFMNLCNSKRKEEALYYNIIAGPSTQFKHREELPHPGIYGHNNYLPDVSIFDFFDILDELTEIKARISRSESSVNEKQNEENISFINGKITELELTREKCDLDPKYYMPRFIDKLRSDNTIGQIQATFIHIKHDMKKVGDSYNYDFSSDRFRADQQVHYLHYTNLLNANAAKEIAEHNTSYTGGRIFTSGDPDHSKFTIDGIFSAEDASKLYKFILFSVLLTGYTYKWFDDLEAPEGDTLREKWMRRIKPFKVFGKSIAATDQKKEEGKQNSAFSVEVKKQIVNFAWSYIRPVLQCFEDIDRISEEVSFFPEEDIRDAEGRTEVPHGMNGIVKGIISSISQGGISIADDVRGSTQKRLAAIAMNKFSFKDFDSTLTAIKGNEGNKTDFLHSYQENFPVFGNKDDIHSWNEDDEKDLGKAGEKYFKDILKYTYDTVSKFFKV